MSTVPAKTSTRPSGLSLIQACDGSPFWFMPVGYSIVAKPRPRCLAISVHLGELGDEVLREELACARLARHPAVLGTELDADPLRRGERHRHGRGILEHDAVTGRV